jgi:hypothetical protein
MTKTVIYNGYARGYHDGLVEGRAQGSWDERRRIVQILKRYPNYIISQVMEEIERGEEKRR